MRLYKKYVNETIDEKGRLQGISFNIPRDFNFGFDVLDALAQKSPHKRALLRVDERGELSPSPRLKHSNKNRQLFCKQRHKERRQSNAGHEAAP